MPANPRLAEAHEGIGFVREEIADWINGYALPGAHKSRLQTLKQILNLTLDAVDHLPAGDIDQIGPAYRAARRTEKRALFCRRLFRWYTLRFDQRKEDALRSCLLGADEVVWSVWKRTFDRAGVTVAPPPLCFIDNDPVPWASFHHELPSEAQPPSQDPFFLDRVRDLPVPVIGLPPLVALRPWWLVTAIHETGHHIQHTLAPGLVESIAADIRDAAIASGVTPAEAKQWSEWSEELFADAFAAVFAGPASLWAISELERVGPDLLETRSTYPPAVVRLELATYLVQEIDQVPPPKFVLAEPAALPDLGGIKLLLDAIPVVAAALLDHPLGKTTLRTLADRQSVPGAASATQMRATWRATLLDGTAQPVKSIEAAADCVSGAVLAWFATLEASPLRERVLAVLPLCSPDGTRAGGADLVADAAHRLIEALTVDGAEP